MSSYTLQPANTRRTWLATVGVGLVALLGPLIAGPFLPERTPELTAVTVGSEETEVGVECLRDEMGLVPTTWKCDGEVTVITHEERQTEDRELALRRMVRALGSALDSPSSATEVLSADDMMLLIDPVGNVVAVSKQVSNEDAENSQVFVIMEGPAPAVEKILEPVWTTLSDLPRPEYEL